MVSRRNSLIDKEGKLPKLLEEAGMRHFISVSPCRRLLSYVDPDRYMSCQHPKFLESAAEPDLDVNIPLFNLSDSSSGHTERDNSTIPLSPSRTTGITVPRPGVIRLPPLSPLMSRAAALRINGDEEGSIPPKSPLQGAQLYPTIPTPTMLESSSVDSPSPPKKRRAIRFAD